MITVTKSQWAKIHPDYKGQWTRAIADLRGDLPEEYIGKRTVMGGCIGDEMGVLLTEGAHFEIVEG